MDITDRKRIDSALRLSEQRSALALDVAQLGTWSWDADGGALRLDARAAQIGGADPARESFTLEDLARRCIRTTGPASRRRCRRRSRPMGDGLFAEEFRLVHPDGRVVGR